MLAIIPFIISVIFLNEPPISLLEISQLPLSINIISYEYLWVYRIPHSITLIISAYLISIHIFKRNSFLAAVVFASSPWFIMNMHEFSPLVGLFILMSSIYISLPKYRKISTISLLGILVYLGLHTGQNLVTLVLSRLGMLKDLVDINTLFMQMEPISGYLRVPRNGYFHLITIIPFLVAIYTYLRSISGKVIQNYIIPMITSIVFFLVYPTNHLVFAGVGILFIYTLIIIDGIRTIASHNKFLFSLSFILLTLSTVFFYEMYLRQMPVMYAGERSEGKFYVIDHIASSDAKEFYIPNDRDLKTLVDLNSRNLKGKKINFIDQQKQWLELVPTCEQDTVDCVVDDGVLHDFPINKDDEKLTPLRLRNYLANYCIL